MSDDLKYRLGLDSSGFSRGMNDAFGATQKLDAAFEGLGKKIAGIGAAYLTFDFLKSALDSFEKAEMATEGLKEALGTKGLSGNLDELLNQANELREKGIFGATATKEAEELAVTYGLSVDKIKEMMPLVEDFAARKHIGVSEAMGEVLRSSVGRLGPDLRIAGLQLDAHLTKTQKLAKTIEFIKENWQGANEEIAKNTTFGQITQMTNDWNTFKNLIGEGVAKAFSVVRPYIIDVIDSLKELAHWIGDNWGKIKTITEIVLVAYGAFKLWQGIISLMAIKEMVLYQLKLISMAAATEGMTVAQYALNVAMEANPIGIFITAIAALGVALVALGVDYDDVKNKIAEGHTNAYVQKNFNTSVEYEMKKNHHLKASIDDLNNARSTSIYTQQKQIDEQQKFIDKINYQFKHGYSGRAALGTKVYSKEDLAEQEGTLEAYQNQLEFIKKAGYTGSAIKSNKEAAGKAPSEKETARENITINYNKPIIETFIQNNNTVKENLRDLKQAVATIMHESTSAVITQ